MKFIINSSSNYEMFETKNTKIERMNLVEYDIRTVATLEEARKTKWGKAWFKDGENHREENGNVVRDVQYYERDYTTIELNTLQELFDLIAETKCSIILSKTRYRDFDYKIEIYNDYKE